MKTKLYKILTIGLLSISAGCTDLDEEPVGLLAPESFFKTAGDAEAAVLSGYGLMGKEEYYGRRLTMTLQLLDDMGTIGDQGTAASRRALDKFILDAGNDNTEHIWNTSYAIIGAANAAIEGIKKVENIQEAKRAALDAEARTIRALAYYHLVQFFGDVPKIDYFINTPQEVEAVKKISKSPASEIYSLIISDLESTYAALPDKYPGNVRSRASKGTALTLLASTHLTVGNWGKAAEYAELVIKNKSNFGYSLMPDFNQLWDANTGDMAEHVWTVDFLGQVGGSNFNVDYIGAVTGVRGANMQGWSVVVASPGVLNSFKDEDKRKATFITEAAHKDGMRPWTKFQDPYVHTGKWALKPGNAQATGANSDHNLVVFRYAEVLLIAAEALNEANGGPTPEAYNYINEVRRRAGFTEDLAGLGQEEFRAAVREERRLEFAFEWKRWYDLKRWNLIPEAFTGPGSYEPQPNAQEFHKLMPIPQAELSRNPNLLPQNPGYN